MLRHALRAGLLLALLAKGGLVWGQPRSSDAPLPGTIPIFPLQDMMLFPGVQRPLYIFEPRYREMIEDALDGDRIIGMVMLRPGYEDDYEGNPPIYDIGCAGRITDVERLPDGRYNIVVLGLARFRVTEEDQSRSYRVATIDVLDEPIDDADRTALRGLRPTLLQLLPPVGPGETPTPDELPDEVLVNGLAQFLGMEPADRLDLLRQSGPLARAKTLIELLDMDALSR